MSSESGADEKARLRLTAWAVRRKAFDLDAAGAAQSLAGHVMAVLAGSPAASIAAYHAVGSEIDPGPLMARLDGGGRVVALPVVVGEARPLLFRRWRSGDELEPGRHGTRQPLAERAEVEPDVVIAPLLAFDDQRYRLGQGGGYYDRTLEKLKKRRRGVLSIGVAFAAQRIDRAPRGRFDQPLDMIVTERGRC